MDELAIKIEHVSKEYRLGAIGGGTLRGDLQTWWARKRGKEDPNSRIGSRTDVKVGERFLALDDINIEVKKGEALGIIGHNGAGKSTLLKLLSRVTAPTSGTISYNGRIASMLEVGTGFHPELTGRENVYMNGAILGMTKKEIDAKMEEIIDFSEVRQFIDTPVKRYSSGMYVKLAFSVAAHLDSEIMIMDEVLAVGDMAFQKKCLTKMREAADKEGRTVLYVSHNMNTIRQLCDRCIVLDHGKAIFDGDVEDAIEVYSNVMSVSDRRIELVNLRRNPDETTGEVFMKWVEICGLDTWRVDVGEPLRFTIAAKCNASLDGVGFRSRICTSDDTVISVYLAPRILNCEENEDTEVTLQIDTSMLIPGRYKLNLAFYGMNEYGGEQFYDRLENAVMFEIQNIQGFNGNKPWDRFSWGIVKLPAIKLISLNTSKNGATDSSGINKN
jgi:lipopolysaccharide transport system ATP-binding protein